MSFLKSKIIDLQDLLIYRINIDFFDLVYVELFGLMPHAGFYFVTPLR